VGVLLAIGVGATAGTHVATWGMYKDSVHEGFHLSRYGRSILLAIVVSLTMLLLAPVKLLDAPDLVAYFGVVYAFERVLTELWKSIAREDDQSKYTIPMRLAVGGRVLERRTTRYAVGAALTATLVLLGLGLQLAQSDFPEATGWPVVLTIGGLAGWFSAVGGAWKDAPIEGFDPLKFPRSPLIATAWAVPVALFTSNWFVLSVSAAGWAVATIETYKKFWAPDRPPGKFAGQPVNHPEMLETRRRFRVLFVALWLVILAVFSIALNEPHRGLLSL